MKLYFERSEQPAALALAAAICLLVSACGGGGAGGADVPAASAAMQAAEAAPVTAAPASSATTSPSVATAAADPTTPDEMLAQAMVASDASNSVAATERLEAFSPNATTASPGTETTDVVALAVGKLSGTAAVRVITTVGTVYYVDSRLGSDANNGLAATAGTGAAGPWQSMAKLKAAALLPGDIVRLACGSEWTETLALAASGNVSSPISVVSYPGGCTNKPLINGSISIAAGQWTQYRGNIYKATLATAPTQVFSSTGFLTQAHHPNRGYDSADPNSMYLRLAAASDNVLVNNRLTSSYIMTGANLALPAGATVGSGTQVRIRSNAWTIEDKTITNIAGSKFTLSTPTANPLSAGWGYYLLGQLWMLDAPGEWHYDPIAKTLYAWMPDSRPPSTPVSATRLSTGVDLESRRYITVDGLAIKMATTGLNLKSSTGVIIRNSQVEDTMDHGINAASSQDTVVQGNVFTRIGLDAVSGHDDIMPASTSMQVTNNTMSEVGVAMNGETVVSLPRRTRAAIRPGANAIVSGNSISNTGYNGIHALANSTITKNTFFGTCTVLDDCGAIYASGANNNSVISGNLIRRSRGALAGKSSSIPYTQGQGIYLDELASGVTVSSNTVMDADNGIHLHISANNIIKDNKLFGNRKSQIWMQETRNPVNPLGDVFGNTITGNQIVPTSGDAMGLYLDTQITDTSRFGSFDWNRYFDRVFATIAVESTPAQRTESNLLQWKAANKAGAPRNLDVNGTGTSQTRFASVLMNGSNIVPNGNVAVNSKGWGTWNQTSPYGTMAREACAAGWCMRYVAGGSPGILSSPNFSTTVGTWYRLSADIATGSEGQLVNLVVRRGGGGNNGYELLNDRSLNITAGRTWMRYSVIFKSTGTVNAADPVTRDLGARVDIQNIAPGHTVSVGNLELVPITPAEALTRSDILLNAGDVATQLSCPVAATQPTLCSIYVRLSDNQPVTWPYYLLARSAELVYSRDARLVDTDGDGIADSQDQCPNTPWGAAVNSRGCSLSQL